MEHISRKDLEIMLHENMPDLTDKKLWIWGAGNTAQLYQEGLRRLEKEGFVIEGYADRKAAKSEKEFNGKPLVEPEKLSDLKNVCVLICTIQTDVIREISEQCSKLCLQWHLIDEVILKMHGTEVMECYDLLDDQHSKDVYANLIKWRITNIKPKMDIWQKNAYFALKPFDLENPNEVFVDCGAYIGDTLKDFIEQRNGLFKKFIAFEPDIVNFGRLKEQAEKECNERNLSNDIFELYPYGIGEKNSIGQFERYENDKGLGSKMVDTGPGKEGNCRIVALDSFLSEPYSFLKADIESYEYQMILGAQKGIKEYEPMLAICIYHNAIDFYSIPLLIKQIVPKYHIAVRHHASDLAETVMYAWV